MAHPRTLVRRAVIARLTNATTAGARVQGTRVEPLKKTLLPAISVETFKEPVDPDSADTEPRELLRMLSVEVIGWVALNGVAPNDVCDVIDDLAEQIEAAMDADRYLGGAAADSVLEDTEIEIRDDGNDPLIGVVVLTYSVTYRTTSGATATDDFLTAGVTTQIVGAAANNVAGDLVDVRP